LPSPIGTLELSYTETAVISLQRVHTPSINEASLTWLGKEVARELREYFAGTRTQFDLPMAPAGTPFQQKVWAALCDIPYGETRTYQEIAQAVGNIKAARAVGMANNRNPISIAIPCHRVIGKNGALVGYASGLEMKEQLLQLEQTHSD
jgi:O-6-methylguanine DNA methyltransferase